MHLLTLAIAALTAIVVAAVLSRRTGIATPLVLLVVGIVFSLVPATPEFELEPDWILLGALPPLLYATAVQVPVIDLRRSFGMITWLSVTLVVVSALAVGAVVHLVVPEVSFAAGVALGAVVSPTDAVAATAIGKRLGLPHRLMTVLEGESLLNDASALVVLRTALLAITAGFSLGDAVLDFVRAVALAALVGYVVGHATVWLRSRLDDPVLTTAVSFIVPFLAFLPAEEAEASGVVAVVVAGLVAGHHGARRFSARERLTERTNWLTLQFLVENGVFLLMGLQLESLLRDLDDSSSTPQEVLGIAALVLALLLVLRVGFVGVEILGERRQQPRLDAMRRRLDQISDRVDSMADQGGPRIDSPRGQQRMSQFRRRVARGRADVAYQASEPVTARGGAVLSWAGMRGVVTLAAALTIPPEVEERTLLVTVAFVVAVVSLLVYGGTLPLLIRRLGVSGVDPDRERAEVAELFGDITTTAAAALGPLDQIVIDGQPIDRDLAEQQLAWLERVEEHRAGGTPEALTQQAQRLLLHREFISLMREALHEERAIGAYSTGALARASSMIDAQELRLDR
ncbi:CPA1 family monovalent cation:H+ antiporter [Nocardioides cavernae]|uniref:CPA1 family monovalent cation:H+ antiporter n=1 Tax=Nocardioides cavernae TaxID=1921566 RepID=A0A7Y9H567_9ACTN|nr:sodium:proton antiporter [Nocardioides cavernae]NYE38087.1 CPA1 family monovalent cation:H+ antiporter [Nocardioides cavernae]